MSAEKVIDSKKVAEIAKLARLQIDESQLEAIAQDLNRILVFVGIIMKPELDKSLEGLKPMTSVTPMNLKPRTDEVNDGGYPDRILANAPEAREGFFVVPKVVE